MPFRLEAEAPVRQAVPSPSLTPPQPKVSRFSETLAQLGHRVDAGEGWMRRAMSPAAGGLDAAQLIALQAGIYRYTEAVELVGKLVDRASNGVKTLLQPH
ncbi:MAG TPA: hypothetical protein VFQ35_06590 [Polyangiaceae bacterium]|nr:hypothetical protein [Polyangiaceae bacterium]